MPNCTTIVAMMALAPLHRAAGLRSIVPSSSYRRVRAGREGTRELAEQIGKLHDQVEELGRPHVDALPVGDVFGKTMAFNVLPEDDGSRTPVERREDEDASGGVEEDPRTPGPRGRGDVRARPRAGGAPVSVLARFARDSLEEARARRRRAGCRARDDPPNGVYPSPLEAAGRDEGARGPASGRRPVTTSRAAAVRVR